MAIMSCQLKMEDKIESDTSVEDACGGPKFVLNLFMMETPERHLTVVGNIRQSVDLASGGGSLIKRQWLLTAVILLK